MRVHHYLLLLIITLSCFFLSCQQEDAVTTSQDKSIKINIPTTKLDWGVIVYGAAIDKIYSFTCDASSGDKLKGTVNLSGDGFVLVNGGGTYSLVPGAARTVKIRFFPDRRGSFSGTLTISHNGANRATPVNVILVGSAN